MDQDEKLPKIGIKQVSIRNLFGSYSYELPSRSDGLGKIAILYGDNGAGKTTVLNLIFHMLSPADDRGHRTAIGKIAFNLIRIELYDGTTIEAIRDGDPHTQEYHLRIKRPKMETIKLLYDPNERAGLVPLDAREKYRSFLSTFSLSVFNLSAEREILSDNWTRSGAEQEIFERSIRHDPPTGRALEQFRKISLDRAIFYANSWISQRAVQGTNIGSESTNEIYERIVRRIANPSFPALSEKESGISEITNTLKTLARRNEYFSKFQFTSTLRVDDMVSELSNANPETGAMITSILEPYIAGIEARLNALEEVKNITDVLVRNFNDFYTNKSVHFDLSNGLKIMSDNGVELSPSDLSSGEQQLLMLFCHTIVSRDQPSIFIIDEPELSLNIKWQRKLVRALLDLVEGSDMQYLFATHSLELLSQHRPNVHKLTNQK